MKKDKRKRSIEADGGSSGSRERKKGREVETDPVVVTPPTDDEVDEFFAILRRMREAIKYFEKGKGGDHSVKERSNVAVLDLNTVPDDDQE